jgi:hypothetical protein
MLFNLVVLNLVNGGSNVQQIEKLDEMDSS